MPRSRHPFDRVDWARVRIHKGGGSGDLLCRAVLWVSGGRAVALGNTVFLPDQCRGDVGVLAHELTHCAQYQAWGAWRYFTRGAVAQMRELLYRMLGVGTSPYAYTLDTTKPLHAYGMEQQAQIIEDEVRRALLRGSPPRVPEYSRPDRRSSP